MLVDHRFDILAWNREMSRLLLDIDGPAPTHRNTRRLCLTHPGMREFYWIGTRSSTRSAGGASR
ncbi:hypothetical protein [Nocardia cyriacigeorgica]|uniref:MmyB family transcriptional regulator n=1 Tax=Nocardia cyriacigeorgica TaxID=135487 RepID=UPI0002E627A9|nr:hypothetical protein [Nocardia cyriacigeorgica]MBF6495963.1 hypothetical protein [Nocardia cyriacigeorgica]